MSGSDPYGWTGFFIDHRFRIDSLAGEGGFGAVYKGWHVGLDEPIAVKLLKVDDASQEAERLRIQREIQREAKLLHRLSGRTRHVVRVLDAGGVVSPSGRYTPYIVMEWLQGKTLARDLTERAEAGAPPHTPAEAFRLLAPVVEALHAAHEEGIVHRDVKPANIFLTEARGAIEAKLLDFGVAKLLEDTARSGHVSPGGRVFTPQYGAPEQWSERYGPTGPATDVFALALVLVEVLSGKKALDGSDRAQLFEAACNEHVRPTLRSRGVHAERLDGLLREALEVWPSRRQASVAALWEALRAEVERPVRAPLHEAASLETDAQERAASRSRVQRTGADPSSREHRICAVLVADLSALTERAESLGSERVRDLLGQVERAAHEAATRFGGHIQGSVGDTVTGVFGWTAAQEDSAERAVRTAIELHARFQEIIGADRVLGRRQLSARTGIHVGRAFPGPVPASGEATQIIAGDAVHVATQIAHTAAHGTIVVSRDASRQIAPRFVVSPIDASSSNVSKGALRYQVIGPSTTPLALGPTDFYGQETKLVGRAALLRRLEEAFETAVTERRPMIVTLVGPPGSGKTRILGELLARLFERPVGCVLLAAQASPMSKETSYGVAASMIRMRFGIRSEDPPEVVRQKLRDDALWFRDRSTERPAEASITSDKESIRALRDAFSHVETLLGARAPDAARSLETHDRGDGARHRIAAAVALLLRRTSARKPVVVLCDDIHWADDASLDLFGQIAVRGAGTPILLVCGARPEIEERSVDWSDDPRIHVRIDVDPLSEGQMEEMLRDRLRCATELPQALERALVDLADGSPLVLEETLRLLVDSGHIERGADGSWTVHADRVPSLSLPSSIRGIAQARLERLDPEHRALLGQAAVIGRTFWEGALMHLRSCESVEPEIPSSSMSLLLSSLRARQVLWARPASMFPGERELVFAESALWNAAYEGLSVASRRRLHREVATWLGRRERGDAGAALLARHHDRGGDLELAAKAYARAAAHAASLGQIDEAIRHAERAREIHDATSEPADGPDDLLSLADDLRDLRVATWQERVRLRADLGNLLRKAGKSDEAERVTREARDAIVREERREGWPFDPHEPGLWEARLCFRMALLRRSQGDAAGARDLVLRAIDGATSAGARDETAPMWAVLVALARRAGDMETAKEAALQGLRTCRSLPARDERRGESASYLLGALGVLFWSTGRTVRALRCCQQAARAADGARDPMAVAIALNTLAVVRASTGELARAREVFIEALAWTEKSGDLHQLAIAHNNLAEIEQRMGDPLAALPYAKSAVRLGEQLRAPDLPELRRTLADALRAAGLSD